MASATTAAMAIATGRRPVDDGGLYNFARWLLPLFAVSTGNFLVQSSTAFTDQTFIVMLLTCIAILVINAIRSAMRHWYLKNDGIIDATENVNLMAVEFVGIVVACMVPSFLFIILREAFDGWTLPEWYEIGPYAWLLIVIVILFSRYLGQLFSVAKTATETVLTTTETTTMATKRAAASRQ